MKTTTILSVALIGLLGTAAQAGMTTFTADIENFGASDPDGVASSPEVIFETTFALGAIDSIDGFSVDLAHSFLSDMDMRLIAPDGAEFIFAVGQAGGAFPDFSGGFDGADLGDGGSLLAGVATYNFAEAGDAWNDANGVTVPTAGGTFAAVQWQSGGWAAGDWTLTIIDAWDSLDDGALGSMTVSYTDAIPTPGALAMLGMAGLAGRRRRRA
ncbi:MAG: hypothetical protein AAF432_08350 [Planctomycetota bacterium]